MHHSRVVKFSIFFFFLSGSKFVSYLGTSKKLSLGV